MGIISMMRDFERNLIQERYMEWIRMQKCKLSYAGRKIRSYING